MTGYWLLVERYENWLVDQREGFRKLGFSDRHVARIKKMQKGDKIVVYIAGKSSFAGIYEVVSPTYYRDTELVWDEIFPIRIEVKPEIILREDAFIPVKNILNELSFTKDKGERWGKCFQNPLRQLKDEDYERLLRLMRQATN